MISSKELSLTDQQIMEENGKKLRQYFKDMKQVIKMKINVQ
jgi:hypothetical protein